MVKRNLALYLTVLLFFVVSVMMAFSGCTNEMELMNNQTERTAETNLAQTSEPENPAASSSGNHGSKVSRNISFTTEDLAGNIITQDDLITKKLTMINIWTTWCGPCVNELPELQKISRDYADKGLQLVGLLYDGADEYDGKRADDVIETAKSLLASANADYTVIIPDAGIRESLLKDLEAFPTTVFLNDSGKVLKTVIGSKDYEGWSNEIDKILNELYG